MLIFNFREITELLQKKKKGKSEILSEIGNENRTVHLMTLMDYCLCNSTKQGTVVQSPI